VKVLLDTNILVAAFTTQGLCHAVFELCLDHQQIILSPEILKEFIAALEKKLKVPHRTTQQTATYLRQHAAVHRMAGPYPRIARDPSDDHILALAERAAVNYIITGDEDLLVLAAYKGIPIVKPRQFWEILKTTESESR
jgi:putative PIN family toxin of toxin-antitoxin system